MADYNDDLSFPDPFYISDIETYELLYLNEAGRRLFGVGADEELGGVKCYELLQNGDAPCSFCTNHLLSTDKSYVWEFTNPITKHRLLLNDRLINWGGKLVRLEVGFDLTNEKAEGMRFRNLHESEQVILQIANELYREMDVDRASNHMIEQLGKGFHAQRAYLFELKDGLYNNTYEWCAEGVSSEMEHLQGIDYASFSRWFDLFAQGECVIIEDVSSLQGAEDPTEYEMLSAQGIKSLVVAPIERDGEVAGILGLDNPPVDQIRDIAPMLLTLCYFFTMTMERIENEQRLVMMSYHDSLTGLYNRNRYNLDVQALERLARPFGAIFLDVNGMKEINDRGGHAEGDRLLQACAATMRAVLGETARMYRVGGDEFVATVVDEGEAGFRALVQKLQQAFGEDSACEVAIGAQWTAHSSDVDKALFDADEAMYRDKRKFYRRKFAFASPEASQARTARHGDVLGTVVGEEFSVNGSFMDAIGIGFARHLLDESFTVLSANKRYSELVSGCEGAEEVIGSLALQAFNGGELGFSGPYRMV